MELKNFLKKFDVLLFDMGNTFMFSCDRFKNQHKYKNLYQPLKGKKSTDAQMKEFIIYTYNEMLQLTRNEKYYRNFPTVRDFINSNSYFNNIDEVEKEILIKVFASLECGEIPEDSQYVIKELSKKYKLGLISNVLSDSLIFKKKLQQCHLFKLFKLQIFSSDYKILKPSSELFLMAMRYFKLPSEKTIYIGDNYKRDVVGIKSVGGYSILVNNNSSSEIKGNIKPDYIINNINELLA